MKAPVAERSRLWAGLPGSERHIDVGGLDTVVYEAGKGPPLVLLHGGIESGGVYWAPVVAALAEQYRVVIPDAPGMGESAPAERLDSEHFDAWLTELLRVTGAQSATLVAHSLLGSLAAGYAARHSRQLRRLVIYGAPGIGPYRLPVRLKYIAIRFAIRPTARNNERFERFFLLDRDATRARDAVWFDTFSEYSRARATVSHVKRTMWRLIGTGTKRISDEDLRQITVPVDLVWGREDRTVPLSLAEDAAKRFGWPVHVISGAAHVPHIEQPESFVRVMREIDPVQETDTYTTGEIREYPASMRVA
jgi:pimeloyl-ACP methyl ester carboxylesterase